MCVCEFLKSVGVGVRRCDVCIESIYCLRKFRKIIKLNIKCLVKLIMIYVLNYI